MQRLEKWAFKGIDKANSNDVALRDTLRDALGDEKGGSINSVKIGEPLAVLEIKGGEKRMTHDELSRHFSVAIDNREEKAHQIDALSEAVKAFKNKPAAPAP